MEELTIILKEHALRYPLMEPTDAVKLVYQNEFGGGHLIRDEEACLAFLHREYAAVEKRPELPLWESIGNGLVRVNLAAMDCADYSPEQLGRDFIRSAAVHQGSMAEFLRKLEQLRTAAREGIFGFSDEELAQYLDGYAKAGYPMVSHSPAYRRAYRPAYRVVRKEMLK